MNDDHVSLAALSKSPSVCRGVSFPAPSVFCFHFDVHIPETWESKAHLSAGLCLRPGCVGFDPTGQMHQKSLISVLFGIVPPPVMFLNMPVDDELQV